MFHGSPPAHDHQGYIVVLPKCSPRSHKDLQWEVNMPDQQVRDVCPEDGGTLHIFGAWYPTKEELITFTFIYAYTTHAEHV